MFVRTLVLGSLVALLSVGAAAAEKLDGYAEYRRGIYLIVDGQRVRVNEKTRYRGDARNFASIPLGWEVEVKGKRLDDGAVLARKIEARRNRDLEMETDLKQSFDQIEAFYRQRGRMQMLDAHGKVLEDHGELLESGPLVDRVQRIAAGLAPPYLKPEDFRVYVVDNKEWNAMAAPNYSIYVFSGLLRDMSDNEVALVLGHELAHATHEHSRKQARRNIWVSFGALAAAVVADSAIEDDEARLATQAAAIGGALALTTGYSRNHEDQSDRVGMRYAYEGGYDVRQGPALWSRFAEKYGDSPVLVNFFFGDHSRSSKRADLLRLEIERNYSAPATVSAH